MIAAEYDINIIANELETSIWMTPEMIFCCMLALQFALKFLGTYWLFDENQDKKGPTAPNLVKLSLCMDSSFLIVLLYLFFTN